jgi:hypothetical protein
MFRGFSLYMLRKARTTGFNSSATIVQLVNPSILCRTVLQQQDMIQDRAKQIEQTPDANRYRRLCKFLGPRSADEILRQAKQQKTQKQQSCSRSG